MTTRFDDKDPADVITLEFDFGPDLIAVTAPVVTCVTFSGVDASPAAILIGSPVVLGAKVLQRVRDGLAGVDYALQCLAYAGSDRYTIEAILPVRARPAADTAVARYLTATQFEARFGAVELADLLAGGASYAQAENDAASLIDGYLSSRYTLPLASVPALVAGWAGNLTRFMLWDDHAPEEVRKRYDDTLAQLKLLAGGTISLPPDALGVAAASGGDFAGFSNDRVFTSSTLGCF